MKFGKEIQAQQIHGWSRYYLDYKFLKKIISSLAANRPASEAAALAAGIRPSEVPISPSATPTEEKDVSSEDFVMLDPAILTGNFGDDGRSSIFKAHRKAFFFKLERELEKINEFYLQKEQELRLRLTTLLAKRNAAMERSKRNAAEDGADTNVDSVEWRAIEEGFRALQKDLSKLQASPICVLTVPWLTMGEQQFIEINATGFRKILKKWDKRSKSHTKELYLSRQVEVQPCFNRQLLAELSNIVASALLDLEHSPEVITVNGESLGDSEEHRSALERQAEAAYTEFESNLSRLIVLKDEDGVRALLPEMDALLEQRTDAKTHITRILWKAIIDAPPHIADILISNTPFDFSFVDDISGRSCLHEAAIAGEGRLVRFCLERRVNVDLQDLYGRTALQYASMNGHAAVCKQLLDAGAKVDLVDADNYTALVYAVMNGKQDCVEVLLDQPGVRIDPTGPDEFNLLSLACQYGHENVARLLLNHGARLLPNSSGEYPLHVAAREGHAELCRTLACEASVKDIPDKYSEWTPLFHAARNGHDDCVKILLEAGCNANARDDAGKTPLFYAAWHGHISCVNLLLRAGSPPGPTGMSSASSINSLSPASQQTDDAMMVDADGDVDNIPSLSLPPPAMPLRIYGHSYLNRSCLIQVALGEPFFRAKGDTAVQAVQLHSRVTGAPYIHSGPSLKLVMATKPDIASAPHTVILPLHDEMEVFNFQTETLDNLSLEFSLYPAFGSRLMGRAVIIPSRADGRRLSETIVLPIMDHRLQVIGTVSFELRIINPFGGASLDVGGEVETYWKSSTVPQTVLPSLNSQIRLPSIPASLRSPAVTAPVNNLTVSSLVGEYVHAVIQVTRDMVPVVSSVWRIPDEDYDLSVSQVTYNQFLSIAKRKRRSPPDAAKLATLTTASAWRQALSHCLLSLEDFLRIVPPAYGVSLELIYFTPHIKTILGFGQSRWLNLFIDAVLQTVYNGAHVGGLSGDPRSSRRKVVFSSYQPDVCVALNWKQPNYAVLFASFCGIGGSGPARTDDTFVPDEVEIDRRCLSVDAAVHFAKSNNLLGVILNGSLLARVPSLLRSVKDTGVILGVFGSRDDIYTISTLAGGSTVDATLQDGVIRYMDHALTVAV